MRDFIDRRIMPLALSALVAVGCSDSNGSETAIISLSLTDGPGEVDSVWVDLGEVYLQGGGGDGRVTLLTEDQADALGLIELTQLAGTTLDLVSDVVIGAGNYGQLRFVVQGAVLQTAEGGVFAYNATHPHDLPATGTLTCPSCTTTGIKVLLPGDVADLEAGAHLLVLDFDVSQSFGHAAGGSGDWVMHPVILGAELGFTGSVVGTVGFAEGLSSADLACPAGMPRDLTYFVPRAVAQTLTDDLGDPLTTTTSVAEDGSFSFAFLNPDSYDFGYVAAADIQGGYTLSFVAEAPGVTNVGAGAQIELTYTITGASCPS
jgi:hypothetical protein